MSALVMPARPPSLTGRQEPPRLAPGHDDESTLEDVVVGVWADLSSAGARAACPVCRGEMAARYGAGPAPVGGRCLDCASEIA